MSEQLPNFCGVSENLLELARTGNYRWNKRDLAYCIHDRVAGFSLDEFEGVVAWVYKQWSAVCGLTFTQVTDPRRADLLLLARRIDGRGGILAEHQLPPGNDMQLRGWLDLSEGWTLEMLKAVLCHEIGHGLGLPHTNVPNSLMNAFYNPAISTPQAWEIEASQTLYGKSRVIVPTPAPTPIPQPDPDSPVHFTGMFEIPAGLSPGMYQATFQKMM